MLNNSGQNFAHLWSTFSIWSSPRAPWTPHLRWCPGERRRWWGLRRWRTWWETWSRPPRRTPGRTGWGACPHCPRIWTSRTDQLCPLSSFLSSHLSCLLCLWCCKFIYLSSSSFLPPNDEIFVIWHSFYLYLLSIYLISNSNSSLSNFFCLIDILFNDMKWKLLWITKSRNENS